MRRVFSNEGDSSTVLRRFHFSFAFHIMQISFGTLLFSILAIGLFSYGTSYFFIKGTILDVIGKNPILEYILAFICSIFALSSFLFFLSSLLSTYLYAKRTFTVYAEKYFVNEGYENPFKKMVVQPNMSAKPPIPQQLTETTASPINPPNPILEQRFKDGADRARWGPPS